MKLRISPASQGFAWFRQGVQVCLRQPMGFVGLVGMVVDSVSDVRTLDTANIRPPPEFAAAFDTRYITGLGTVEGRMLILVDIERLMASPDMQLVDTMPEAA